MNLQNLKEAVARWDEHKNVFRIPADDIRMFIEAVREIVLKNDIQMGIDSGIGNTAEDVQKRLENKYTDCVSTHCLEAEEIPPNTPVAGDKQ